MKRPFLIAALLLSWLLASCTVGPNYKKPVVNVPATYRGDNPTPTQPNPESLGDQKWQAVFADEELQKLVRKALVQNYDVRIAANRIAQAQEQVRIQRSNQFPTANGSVGVGGTRSPKEGAFPSYSYIVGQVLASASWTVDFWGQYRRATEAARANLVASEWGRRAVLSTVVANVAAAYFQLRELDLELDIARNTLKSRQQSLDLTQTLEQGGATSLVDVRQAQQLVETAAEAIPDTERQIAQTEDSLSVLTGENPHDIPRGRALTDEPLPVTIPAGLPSSLLDRRPDIRESEQQLIAANAEIGVARAQLFPQISLTGQGGFESSALNSLFTPGQGAWTFSGGITQPIFNAGRLRANVRLSEAQQQQALLTYEQTIQNAFRDVSDALIAYKQDRETREHVKLLADYARAASDLSQMRYKGGATSYLEVLTNDTNYFSAELSLARAQLNERLALVQVYSALGGGWQE